MQKLKFIFQFLPYFFLILMGYSLHRTNGFLKLNHLIFLSTFSILFYLREFKNISFTIPKDKMNLMLNISWSIFSLIMVLNHHLVYAKSDSLLLILRILIGCNFLLSIAFLTSRLLKKFELPQKALYFGISMLGLGFILVPLISPTPLIDVYEVIWRGAQFLIEGKSPYSQTYPDLFNGRYGYVAGFVYWPTILLTAVPFQLVNLDVRYADVLGILTLIFFLWKYLGDINFKGEGRLLLILTWLSFPVGFFVLEQAWTENILLPFIMMLIYYSNRKNILMTGVSLGLIFATKQYTIFFGLILGLSVLKDWGLKNSLKMTFVSILTALLFFLPWIFIDGEAFIKESFTELLSYKVRHDSLSWTSYLFRFYDWTMPGSLTAALYLGLPAILIFKRWKTPISIISLFFIQYMVVFMFGKQAFCNYYYLMAFLLILMIPKLNSGKTS